MTNEGICLDALETFSANKQSSMARIVNCADTVRQKWLYNLKTQKIIQQTSGGPGNCLTATPNTGNEPKLALRWNIAEQHANDAPNVQNEESKFNVSTTPCTEDAQQKWMLLPFEWK